MYAENGSITYDLGTIKFPEQLKHLHEVRLAAQETLNTLLQIKNLIQPNNLKVEEVNNFLSLEKSKAFQKETEDEIAYFVEVLKKIDSKIEELENKVEIDTTSPKEKA